MPARVFMFFVIVGCGVLGVFAARINHPERTESSGRVSLTPSATLADRKADPEIERLLKTFAGTWSITDELLPGAKSPQGKHGKGTLVWRPGPGGFSVIEDFRSRQGDEDVSGLGMLWRDAFAQGYHTIWCDSTNPGGCIDFKNTARWEGPTLVLQEDYEVHGKKYTFKEIFGDITSDTFTQTLYGGEAGGPLKIDEVIRAKKVKPGAS